ncbi:unnamed protein product [Rhodiola kirilowii]
MEGLIPYLLHAIKKDKPHHHDIRRHSSFSEGSTRSYHLLTDYAGSGDSLTGSSHSQSHRRTRSEFTQPPSTATNFSAAYESRFNLQHSTAFNHRDGSSSALADQGGKLDPFPVIKSQEGLMSQKC